MLCLSFLPLSSFAFPYMHTERKRNQKHGYTGNAESACKWFVLTLKNTAQKYTEWMNFCIDICNKNFIFK